MIILQVKQVTDCPKCCQDNWLKSQHPVSFHRQVGEVGRSRYTAAAVVDVALSDGIPVLHRSSRAANQFDLDSGSLDTPLPPTGTIETLFVPIPLNGITEIPTTWEGGRICFRIRGPKAGRATTMRFPATDDYR